MFSNIQWTNIILSKPTCITQWKVLNCVSNRLLITNQIWFELHKSQTHLNPVLRFMQKTSHFFAEHNKRLLSIWNSTRGWNGLIGWVNVTWVIIILNCFCSCTCVCICVLPLGGFYLSNSMWWYFPYFVTRRIKVTSAWFLFCFFLVILKLLIYNKWIPLFQEKNTVSLSRFLCFVLWVFP